jgi:iron complex outermembrane receptor protein
MTAKLPLRIGLMLSAATLAPALAIAPAIAQEKAPVGDASAEDDNAIIVTGISHATELQEAPVAISLFTAKNIEQAGIVRPETFLALTPNVNINQSMQSQSQISVRGIAQTNKTGANSPVAVVIDGVPIQDPSEFAQNMYDIEQIEVLKGPQSALYGRNAIAGAIVINTRKPPSEWEGQVKAGISNGGGYKGTAYIGGPLVEDFANFKIVAAYDHLDGLFTNVVTGKGVDYNRQLTLSGRLMLMPAPGLTIDIKGDYGEGRNGSFQYVGLLESNPYYGKSVIDVNDRAPYTPDIRGEYRDHRSKVSMHITYELPTAVLTSTTSYSTIFWRSRGSQYPYLPAADGVTEGTQAAGDNHSAWFQELRLTSNADTRLRYVVGVDLYDYSIRFQTNTGITDTRTALYGVGPFGPDSATPTTTYGNDLMKTKAFGVFGDLAYDVTDTLIADLALRYDYAKLTARNDAPPQFSSSSGEERKASFDQFQPKFTLSWKASEDFMLFGSYGRGFLAGGFNPAGSRETIIAAGQPNTSVRNQYPAETADSFELGFKSDLLGGDMRFNMAGFYTTVKNQQLYQFLPAASLAVIDQIDEVELYGGEMDVNWRFQPGWTAEAAVGLTHSEITSYPGRETAVGNRSPQIPPYSMSFALTHDFTVGDVDGYVRIEDTLRGPQTWEAEVGLVIAQRRSTSSMRVPASTIRAGRS